MSETVEFWFRRRYNLPPNDPRVLALTLEEIQTEFWAHHYFENPAKEEALDEDFDLQALSSADDDEWETLIGHDSETRR